MPIRAENVPRYPPDWPRISERIKFERAGGRCECEGECLTDKHEGRCEARHRELNPRTKSMVWLTVAHLDHTPENCEPENLRAMCQGCHLGYDRKHHRQTRLESIAAEKASWMTPLFEPEVH